MPFSMKHKCLFVHIPRNAGSSFREALGIRSPNNHTPPQELNGDFEYRSKDESKLPIFLQLHHLCMKHIQMLEVLEFSLFTDSLKVAFVRNPWDKVVSAYSHYYHKVSVDFEDYIIKVEKIVSFINENFVFDLENIFYKQYSDLMISTLKLSGPGRFGLNLSINEIALNTYLWVDPHFLPQHLFIYDEFDNQLVDCVGRFENYEKDAEDILNHLGILPNLASQMSKPHLNSSIHENYRDVYNLKTRDIVYNLFKKDIQTFDYTF